MQRVEGDDQVELVPEGEAADVRLREAEVGPRRRPKWLEAKAIISREGSTPKTEPPGTRLAISAVILPLPQPTSRTRSLP